MKSKLFKRLTACAVALITTAAMLPLGAVASAAQNPEVNYTKYYPDMKEGSYFTITYTSKDYTVVTKDLMTNSSGGTGKGLTGGTYVVNSNTTIDERVNIVKGAEVNLIIQPDVTLTCNKGIGCGYNKKGEYATLNICGSGKLVATGTKNTAGIDGCRKNAKTGGDIADAYSPLTYCYKALDSDNTKLVNTVKALYNYHLAAHEYF